MIRPDTMQSLALYCARKLLTDLLENTSLSKVKETGVTLEQDDRRAWEEIRKVWHKLKSCVDKVDQFLCHEDVRDLHAENNDNSQSHEIPIHDVSGLHFKLRKAVASTSTLSETYATASCNNVFVEPIKTCEKLKLKAEGKKQSTKNLRIMSILAAVAVIFACGYMVCDAMEIKNIIIAGVVDGVVQLFAIGVITYLTFCEHMIGI